MRSSSTSVGLVDRSLRCSSSQVMFLSFSTRNNQYIMSLLCKSSNFEVASFVSFNRFSFFFNSRLMLMQLLDFHPYPPIHVFLYLHHLALFASTNFHSVSPIFFQFLIMTAIFFGLFFPFSLNKSKITSIRTVQFFPFLVLLM